MAKCSSAKPSSEANMVKSVNNAHYKALSARDMCAMEKVWTCASNNMLIAPPTNPATPHGLGSNQEKLGGILADIQPV